MVVKMCGGNHGRDIHEDEITQEGCAVGERFAGFDCMTAGIPRRSGLIGVKNYSTGIATSD
jgi:hypothetical protein